MRVAAIGYASEHPNVDAIAFSSDQSVLDYDAAIWSPAGLEAEYRDEYTTVGKDGQAPLLSVAASARLLQDVRRRRQEFARFLERGRIMAIDPPAPVPLRIHIIEDIADFTPFEALPLRLNLSIPPTPANVRFSGGHPFRRFADRMPVSLQARATFDGFPGEPLFHAGDSAAIAGGYVYHHPGHLFFAPLPKSGNREHDEALIALFSRLGGGGLHLDLPEWAGDYPVPGEVDARQKLRALLAEQENLSRQIDAARQDLSEVEHLKALIAGRGSTLSTAVARVFQGFGAIALPGLLSDDSVVVEDGERFLVAVVIDSSAEQDIPGRIEDRLERFRKTFFSDAKGVVIHAPGRPDGTGGANDIAAAQLGANGHAYMTGMDLMHLATSRASLPTPLDRIFAATGHIAEGPASA